jgi:hypothetical protein
MFHQISKYAVSLAYSSGSFLAILDVISVYYGSVALACIEYVIVYSDLTVIVYYGWKMFFITDIRVS